MRCRDLKQWLTVRHASDSVRSEKDHTTRSTGSHEPSPQEEKQSEPHHPSISTARIMQAVEQQRRISQQLEDLHIQQVQRTAILRTKGLKVSVGLVISIWIVSIALTILSIIQPQILAPLRDGTVLLVALAESTSRTIRLIPSNGWIFSGAALVFVLMMALWLRLMRYPREA